LGLPRPLQLVGPHFYLLPQLHLDVLYI